MSMFNIALSGANASRTAMNVTALNIANTHTVGYSRQQAMQSAVAGNGTSMGGVEVSSIRRVADDFITAQLWSSKSSLGNTSYTAANFAKLEQIMGIEGYNISAGMDQFFGAISEASVRPESTPLRQQILSEAEGLAQRFTGLSNVLNEQNKQLASDRNSTVSDINNLLEGIAKNTEALMAAGGSSPILEDERDQLVEQLSELVELDINKGAKGELQLSMSNGQPLLINGKAGKLSTIPLASDPYQANLNVTFNGNNFPVSNNPGGQLGAIDEAQKNDLLPMLDSLDDMAVFIADEVNKALAAGTDLNGAPGKALFSYDPNNPSGSLTMNPLTPDELAFSKTGELGDGGILDDILAITDVKFSVAGHGNVTLDEAFSAMTGKVAFSSRQAQTSFDSSLSLYQQVQSSRDNLSGVSSDEEAANLMIYASAYEANMKVMSTANQMFNTILNAF